LHKNKLKLRKFPYFALQCRKIELMEELLAKKTYTEIVVRSWMLDMYGQVSNPKFMEMLEEARWNHFQGFFESGMFIDLGLAFVLVNVNLNYRGAARLGDLLDIETSIKRIGEKSITLSHLIHRRRNGKMVVDGEMTFVVKDLEKDVAVPITGRMRDMFLRADNFDKDHFP
jgi:thioesterase-3